jgi:hypothetical protein
VSPARNASAATSNVCSEFPSEIEVVVSDRDELSACPFPSESDGPPTENGFAPEAAPASVFPMEHEVGGTTDTSEESPAVPGASEKRGVRRPGASIRSYLWPLVAAAAVLAVEGVARLKDVPVVTPLHSTSAAVGSESAEVVPPIVLPVAPTPAASVETISPDRRAVVESPVAREPRQQRSVVNAVNSKSASAASPPAPAVSTIGVPVSAAIAAATPSITMLAPEVNAAPPAERGAVPAPAAAAANDVDVDKSAIDRVLDTYQQSYTALDAAMVSTIWRGLDTRGLQRAFDALDSQRMSFEHCDVTIADDKARASCTGVLDYVRKFGNANPLQKRLSWNFDLQRTDDDRWLISKVDAR